MENEEWKMERCRLFFNSQFSILNFSKDVVPFLILNSQFSILNFSLDIICLQLLMLSWLVAG